MTQLELHPLCTFFPRLEGDEYASLVADIRENGQRNPIILHDGRILDGGNRYRACRDAGVEPIFAPFDGESIASFVLSVNLHRRHLTVGQKAVLVASVQDWSKTRARGGDQRTKVQPLHLASVTDRATESGASERTQKMADKVARKSPKLAGKIVRGEISLPKAHEQAFKPLPKILPRRDVPKDAPPVADPLDKAREFAKKQNAKLRALTAELAERDATIAAMKEELHESRHIARELAHDLESYMTVSEGGKAIAKELSALKAQMGVIEGTRDQFMNKCNVLVKEVKALQRKLGLRQ